MKEEAKEWIEKAEEDLDTAEFNLKGRKMPAAAFYSQQAAEKALKALQIENLRRFDKVHDLVLLGKSVKAPEGMLKICEDLSPFYMITRYPNSKEAYDKEEVKKAVSSSKEVVEWVRRQLK